MGDRLNPAFLSISNFSYLKSYVHKNDLFLNCKFLNFFLNNHAKVPMAFCIQDDFFNETLGMELQCNFSIKHNES